MKFKITEKTNDNITTYFWDKIKICQVEESAATYVWLHGPLKSYTYDEDKSIYYQLQMFLNDWIRGAAEDISDISDINTDDLIDAIEHRSLSFKQEQKLFDIANPQTDYRLDDLESFYEEFYNPESLYDQMKMEAIMGGWRDKSLDEIIKFFS